MKSKSEKSKINMLSIDPKQLNTAQIQQYLQETISPRPIALASTINQNGQPNLSPFSFFNLFSANPPILVFSPSRRVRNNTTKHTLANIKSTKEVVINVVNYDMVQQTSLASTEYPEEVNEFIKSGFTSIKSDVVKPFRVAESPVQFECKINDIIALGNDGGAGNLVICEVLKIHINKNILDQNGTIDQYKIDLVARLGKNWYSRANLGLFEVPKPLTTLGIGVDQIPNFIKENGLFSGNDLGMLANIEVLPTQEEITTFVNENFSDHEFLNWCKIEKICEKVKEYLAEKQILNAWKLLLAKKEIFINNKKK